MVHGGHETTQRSEDEQLLMQADRIAFRPAKQIDRCQQQRGDTQAMKSHHRTRDIRPAHKDGGEAQDEDAETQRNVREEVLRRGQSQPEG